MAYQPTIWEKGKVLDSTSLMKIEHGL